MEFAVTIRKLLRHKVALGLGVFVSVLAAIYSTYHLSDGTLKARSLVYSSATTQVLVDGTKSFLGDVNTDTDPLVIRATVIANVMASPGTVDLIGQYAGIPGDQIYAAGPVDPIVPRTETEPTALKRNVEITGETQPYRLQFLADTTLPTIGIYAQAPTTAQAVALANASVKAIAHYVGTLQTQGAVPDSAELTFRQLGPPIAAVVDGGIGKKLMLIVFVAVFIFWCILMLVWMRFRDNWRLSAHAPLDDDYDHFVAPAVAPPGVRVVGEEALHDVDPDTESALSANSRSERVVLVGTSTSKQRAVLDDHAGADQGDEAGPPERGLRPIGRLRRTR